MMQVEKIIAITTKPNIVTTAATVATIITDAEDVDVVIVDMDVGSDMVDVEEGGRTKKRWYNITYHNCGETGHITWFCENPGDETYIVLSDTATGFPGVDDHAIRRPPHGNELRQRTRDDDTIAMVWRMRCIGRSSMGKLSGRKGGC